MKPSFICWRSSSYCYTSGYSFSLGFYDQDFVIVVSIDVNLGDIDTSFISQYLFVDSGVKDIFYIYKLLTSLILIA